jgi:hypothetical protein
MYVKEVYVKNNIYNPFRFHFDVGVQEVQGVPAHSLSVTGFQSLTVYQNTT